MRLRVLISIAVLVTACASPEKRNKWQNNNDFVERRNIYYNDFVASGGMIKEENVDQINPMKREIQNSLNEGKTVNNIT